MSLIKKFKFLFSIVLRYINDKEIEEGPDVHLQFNRRDSTYTLTIDKCSPEMQGLIKAVAVNQGGEELCTANLEVRGRAPSFKETPIKCTILEGKVESLLVSVLYRINNHMPNTGTWHISIPCK